jgi:hypothetical protein
MKELNWIASNPEERAKYRGEYIAVVGERIVAHGEDPAQVWDKATTFAAEPLLSYVPKAEALIL